MNLVEVIAFYATLVATMSRKEADQFLCDSGVEQPLHRHIKACVSEQGVLINENGGEFFVEQYQGTPKLPSYVPDPNY